MSNEFVSSLIWELSLHLSHIPNSTVSPVAPPVLPIVLPHFEHSRDSFKGAYISNIFSSRY